MPGQESVPDRARPGVRLGQADAAAAVRVVQPELIVGLDPVLLARHYQVAPVRRPFGRGVQRCRPLAHLLEPRAVRVRRPYVLGAVAVAQEDDPLAVRRVARLRVERQPRGDPPCLAAADRQGVEVPEQLEHDRSAVGREVEREPGPLVGLEGQGPLGLERQAVALVCGGRVDDDPGGVLREERHGVWRERRAGEQEDRGGSGHERSPRRISTDVGGGLSKLQRVPCAR